MIALENMPRNKAILLTFYASGFRVAELCSLKWSDLQSRDKAGQITVFRQRGEDTDCSYSREGLEHAPGIAWRCKR